jgi:hypothetical protein
MKTLKTITALTVLFALFLGFTSCKKDKNEKGGSSYYQFGDTKYTISNANEKHLAGDIFLELSSTTPGDYLQISFAGVAAIPEGTLTYHADRNAGYNAQTNFWATGIGFQGNNVAVSGGTITVSKDGAVTKISFNIDTANGKITGEYNGTPEVTN